MKCEICHCITSENYDCNDQFYCLDCKKEFDVSVAFKDLSDLITRWDLRGLDDSQIQCTLAYHLVLETIAYETTMECVHSIFDFLHESIVHAPLNEKTPSE